MIYKYEAYGHHMRQVLFKHCLFADGHFTSRQEKNCGG